MKYWDSSALVPLLMEEARTAGLQKILSTDAEIITWWGSRIECRSALYRQQRDGRLKESIVAAAELVLVTLARRWLEIGASEIVRETAERLLRGHPLRSGDALQLASTIVAADFRPSNLQFVCCDQRLAAAARQEGFSVTGDR
ncbi:MAG TPA: type II toxin-antitoxin system VapC family toxin [Gemmatimonadales bacterium]|nr:type II toxin-antitoxin system VapC family toxin [Gemmatimonadales bacterium]